MTYYVIPNATRDLCQYGASPCGEVHPYVTQDHVPLAWDKTSLDALFPDEHPYPLLNSYYTQPAPSGLRVRTSDGNGGLIDVVTP